jgi:hypothetical protein
MAQRYASWGQRAADDVEDFAELFQEDAEGFPEAAAAEWALFPSARARALRGGAGEAFSLQRPPGEEFTTQGTVRVSELELRTAVASVADGEALRWTTATTPLHESDAWGKQILRDDYWPAVGVANVAAGGGSWWSARAWSAAFVMFCAGAVRARLQLPNALLGHPTLANNSFHSAYVWQAHRDRSNRVRQRYWAYLPATQPLEVGDIVVKSRDGVTPAQARTHMTDEEYQSYASHGDIVTRISGTDVIAVGGNVVAAGATGPSPPGTTARRRTVYRVDAHGFLDLTEPRAADVFVILKPRGISFRGALRGMVL